MFETESQNYYEILDVKPDATQNEIRQAYFRVKAAYGKDSAALYSLFDEHETRSVLDRVEQAYLVLSNSEKRKEYDRHHGFLKFDESVGASGTYSDEDRNVFSFANAASKNAADAAHQAASTVLGTSASSADDDLFTEKQAPQKPSFDSIRDPFAEVSAFSNSPSASYSSSKSPAPAQEDKSASRITDNRLGIIKRIDIVKPSDLPEDIQAALNGTEDIRGEFIRRVREMRGISLDELSDHTKISKSYLNGLEMEQFEKLPASVYVRGFLQQVAKALKIPHERITNGYMSHYKKTYVK